MFCLFLSVPLCFSLACSFFSFSSFSLSLSLLFFSFFLPSCLSFGSLFLSLSFFLCLSSLLLFHERNNIKRFNCRVFFHQSCVFLCFLPCFLFEVPLSYLFLLIFSYVCVQHQCCWFQKHKLKNTDFWSKGGCNKTVFFITCVL